MKHVRRFTTVLYPLLALACATPVVQAPAIWDVRPSRAFGEVKDAKDDSAADALVARVYRGDGHPRALLQEVETRLGAFPRDHRLHEAAGHLSSFLGDDGAAFTHFVWAALDQGAAPKLREMYIDEALRLPLTVSEEKAALAVLAAIAKAEDRSLAARAIDRRASLLTAHGRQKEANRERRALGFIEELWVIGAFDNDQGKGLLTRYEPEDFPPRLKAKHAGLLGDVSWRKVNLRVADERFALDTLVAPGFEAVAYALIPLVVEREQTVELRLSTSDAVRVFVDGALLKDAREIRRESFDNVIVTVPLSKGAHHVLVKSAQRSGLWRLGVRLTGTGSSPLDDVRVGQLAEEPRAAAQKILERPKLMPDFVEAIAGVERKAFLASRFAFLRGDDQARVPPLLTLAGRFPTADLLALQTAHALRAIGEDGRAIDHLNVAAAKETVAPLAARAAFYVDKGRLDKAQADLELALKDGPPARQARLRLASVFARRGFHIDRCRVLDEAQRAAPDHALTLLELGRCRESLGYDDEAEAIFLAAHKLSPGNRAALIQLARMASDRGEHELATRRLSVVVEQNAADLGARLGRAESLRRARDHDAAEAELRALMSLHPQWAMPKKRMGKLLYERGAREEAIALFREASFSAPNDTELADLVDMLAPDEFGLAARYVPSEDALATWVATSSKVARDPAAAVIYLLDHEVTEVQADGGARRVVTQVALATNTDGRDQLIQTRLPANKIKILHAYAVQPNGERQEASSIRPGVLRFRGLQAGSVTVLQYVHYARPQGFLPTHFFADWFFQGVQTQYARSQWVIILDKGRELAVHKRGEMSERKEMIEGKQVRFFEADGVPAFAPEPFMPPPRDLLRRVSVSTLTAWDEYVRWERALLDEVFRDDPEIEKLARQLTEGANSPRAKFDALFHYVAQEIRYQQDYEDTIAGVRPHACPVVLARGYGDCKDKAVLLILLGKQVGLDIDFAILRTRDAGAVVREVPNQQFNHAIVFVPKQEGIEEGFFLDPTIDALDRGNLRADDQGATSLVLDPETGDWQFRDIPFSPPVREQQKYLVDLVVDKDGARAETLVEARGAFGSQLRQLLRNQDRAQKFHQGVGGRLLVGARVESADVSDVDDIDQPLQVRYRLDATRSVSEVGKERRVLLPGAFMFPLRQAAMLTDRRHAIRFGPPDAVRFDFTIDAGEGARVTHVPEDVDVSHACFSLKRKGVVDGRSAKVEVRYTRTCTNIPAAAYPAFRDAVQDALRQVDGEVRFTPASSGKMARAIGAQRR